MHHVKVLEFKFTLCEAAFAQKDKLKRQMNQVHEKDLVEVVDEASEGNNEEDDTEKEVIRDKHGIVIREKK